jgi:hypothetical protein
MGVCGGLVEHPGGARQSLLVQLVGALRIAKVSRVSERSSSFPLPDNRRRRRFPGQDQMAAGNLPAD